MADRVLNRNDPGSALAQATHLQLQPGLLHVEAPTQQDNGQWTVERDSLLSRPYLQMQLAREVLGFEPRRGFDDSLGELAEWVREQQAEDRVQDARRELEQRGLVA